MCSGSLAIILPSACPACPPRGLRAPCNRNVQAFRAKLRDGVILCNLVNAIAPGTIARVSPMAQQGSLHAPPEKVRGFILTRLMLRPPRHAGPSPERGACERARQQTATAQAKYLRCASCAKSNVKSRIPSGLHQPVLRDVPGAFHPLAVPCECRVTARLPLIPSPPPAARRSLCGERRAGERSRRRLCNPPVARPHRARRLTARPPPACASARSSSAPYGASGCRRSSSSPERAFPLLSAASSLSQPACAPVQKREARGSFATRSTLQQQLPGAGRSLSVRWKRSSGTKAARSWRPYPLCPLPTETATSSTRERRAALRLQSASPGSGGTWCAGPRQCPPRLSLSSSQLIPWLAAHPSPLRPRRPCPGANGEGPVDRALRPLPHAEAQELAEARRARRVSAQSPVGHNPEHAPHRH